MAEGTTAGADAGASLIKLALRDAAGELALECFEAGAFERVASRIREAEAEQVALTGCGAPRLESTLGCGQLVPEFDAWTAGARLRLANPTEPFLMVSVGTGTSALFITPESSTRVGGTSLGGGTLLGLAGALLESRDFDEVAALAARGDRTRVDITVGDLYGDDFELPGHITAAALGKLVATATPSLRRADLAQGIVGLVGENVGMICAQLAIQHGAGRVIFGGGCLRANAFLADTLCSICALTGVTAEVLPDGEYTGALGALQRVSRVA